MAEVAGTLVKYRKRLSEIAGVLVRHGLASWATRGSVVAGLGPVESFVHRLVTTEELKASEGERLRAALTELGTSFVKFGQMLSLRPDVVGQDVAAELSKLQATVAPDPPGVGQRTVEAQLARSVPELFGSFDTVPFASGSVAQVHRATLPDGTAVAVKVMHDGADAKVREDIGLLKAVATYLEEEDEELAKIRPTVLVSEFAAMMEAAIDLRQELQHLQRFRSNFAGEPDVVVPEPYPELSGQKVLTMAMITGTAFSDRPSVEAAGWDAAALARRIADVYLEMIFRDGLYHADPHPGNFLLPDSRHLAILDFGDVGRLTNRRRQQLGTMVIAIGTRDMDSLIDVIVELTKPAPGVDMGELRASIETWLNRYLLVGVSDLDMTAILTGGMEILHQHKLVLPADLALLFRVVLRLQGLGRGVGTEVRVTELLQPYVRQMMAQRLDPDRVARQVSRSARSWDHLAEGLPGQLQAVLDQVRAGNVSVDFRAHDADHATDRLVDGLLAAASILAGAHLVARRASPMLGPFSVPGLVAAGMGVLTWRRLVSHRKAPQSWVTRARKIGEVARH